MPDRLGSRRRVRAISALRRERVRLRLRDQHCSCSRTPEIRLQNQDGSLQRTMKFTNAGNFVCKTNDEAPRVRVKNNEYQAKNQRGATPTIAPSPTKQTKTRDDSPSGLNWRSSGVSISRINRFVRAGQAQDQMRRGSRHEQQIPLALVGGADASPPANGLQKCMAPDRGAIENTIGEQWIAVLAASEPCSLRIATCRAQSLYCADQPRRTPYLQVRGKGLRGAAQ